MIFFMYSSEDMERVQLFYSELRESIDEEIWYAPEKIFSQTSLQGKVRAAIRNSRTILYFLSANSNLEDQKGMLNKEKELIVKYLKKDKGKKFVTVRIGKGGQIPTEIKVSTYFDFSEEADSSSGLLASRNYMKFVDFLSE